MRLPLEIDMKRIAAIPAFSLFLALTVAPARADIGYDCDRSGDNKITAADALIALREAVDSCRRSEYCDVNGDDEQTATDALLLLRVAVSLPTEVNCGCTYVDQCFGDDADCIDSGFPEGYLCVDGTLCGQCAQDSDCGEAEVCDACTYSCVAK